MQIFKRSSQGVRHTLNFDCCTLQKKFSRKEKYKLKTPLSAQTQTNLIEVASSPPAQFKHVYLKQGGKTGP